MSVSANRSATIFGLRHPCHQDRTNATMVSIMNSGSPSRAPAMSARQKIACRMTDMSPKAAALRSTVVMIDAPIPGQGKADSAAVPKNQGTPVWRRIPRRWQDEVLGNPASAMGMRWGAASIPGRFHRY